MATHCHYGAQPPHTSRTIAVTVVDNITAEVILVMAGFQAAEYCLIDVGQKTLYIRSQQIELELHCEQGQEKVYPQ